LRIAKKSRRFVPKETLLEGSGIKIVICRIVNEARRTFFLICTFLLLGCSRIFAQAPIADEDIADKFFSNKNYRDALKCYLLLIKKDPKNFDYQYKAAQCYLLSNSIKAKAIPLLEAIIKNGKYENKVLLDMGRAYHFALRFDDAIKYYEMYQAKVPKDPDVELYWQQCQNGKELVKKKLNVTFENLGKDVNTEFPDYFPFTSESDQTLVFTSRRKSPTASETEFDGLYPSDVFVCAKKGDKWGKAAPIGPSINTNLDEEVTDISADGNSVIFYVDHIQEFGDLWQSQRPKAKGQYNKSFKLNDNINSGLETSGSIWISPEGDSILYFSSSRSGNFGMTDLYMSKKLPGNFGWGAPINLGKNVNTKYKEEFPKVSQDGKTLYFSSQGHSSMGGFDLFKSVWDEDEQAWSAPRNLGYPINTPDDNMCISFVNDRIAYISATRDEGLGDLDIYRITFDDIDGKETIYRGYITGEDSGRIKDAAIHVENKKTHELFGTFVTDRNKGYYIMALPPGKWTVNIEAEGYLIYTEDINVFDYVGFKPEIVRDFKMKK
jgi:tetratricopeptide (TPR) repeat protein